MVPESPETGAILPAPREGGKLWVQIGIMLLLAALALAIGLGFAYVSRCKPGQGNDWCGLGSVAGVVIGIFAAVCILVGGTIMIALKRKSRGGGGGALRILSVVFGVLLVLPCAWMLGVGWSRLHADGGLWFGLVLGLVLIGVAFIGRHRA